MSVKTKFLFAILFAITAVLAPAASADTETLVLDVQGTDFSVSGYGIGVMPNDLHVNLLAQTGSVALFHDVADGTHLGTITLEIFDPAPTLELTYSFTSAIATSFGFYNKGYQVVDVVDFAYASRTVTYPSGSSGPSGPSGSSGSSGSVPEPSTLALLGAGLLCAAVICHHK